METLISITFLILSSGTLREIKSAKFMKIQFKSPQSSCKWSSHALFKKIPLGLGDLNILNFFLHYFFQDTRQQHYNDGTSSCF